MAEKVNIEVDVDYKGAVDNLEKIKDEVTDLGKTTKAQTSVTKSLASGFQGVGFAMKAAGFGIILKVVDALAGALMNNQEIIDTVSTAFNMIGVVMNKIITTFKTIWDRITAVGDNFDALGRIMKNLMTLALTPLKLAFNGIMLVIKEVQLAWEKSWLGKGDQDKIKKLTAQITGYKEEIKKAADEAIAAGQGIAIDFKEGLNEIKNIGNVIVEEFTNTFEDVSVASIHKQAKAITAAQNNIGLLAEAQRKLVIEAEAEAEKQRIIRDDISQTFADRIAANEKLLELSEKARLLEEEGIKKQMASLNTQLAMDSKNIDLLTQKKALETALLEIGLREDKLIKESTEQRNVLLQEQASIQQELAKIGIEEEDRRILEFENEKARLLKLADLTISNAEDLADTKLRIEKDFQKKKDKVDQENATKEQALQDKRRQIIGGALSGITALVGSETAAGKGLAVAQATMDTYAGATKALAQGGLFGYIGAAGVIAAGLANVRNILQTDIPGESGGGGAPPTPEVVEDTTPAVPTFGAIDLEPPPVQAFVVESDVSNSQALQNDLNLQSTL
jgi:hypothetical protein